MADAGEKFGLGHADKIWRQNVKLKKKKAAVKFGYFEVGIYTFTGREGQKRCKRGFDAGNTGES